MTSIFVSQNTHFVNENRVETADIFLPRTHIHPFTSFYTKKHARKRRRGFKFDSYCVTPRCFMV